jgi:uncharacterized protein (DUF488 family)
MPETVWTIGHSTRDLASFLALLQEPKIELLADVRRFPGSRRYPHFNGEALTATLGELGIAYRHFGALGGRRSTRTPGSPNAGWRVEAFNAYADYMGTDEFESALDALIAAASAQRTVIMCSEAVPWRCHRRLIADALTVRGWSVLDILAPHKIEPHRLTDFARVEGTRITYPGEPLFGANDSERV